MIPKPGSYASSSIPSEFDEEGIYVENEADIKEEDDTLGLYSDADIESGFIEESGEVLDDDKI